MSTRFWSLILNEVYSQEGIPFPSDDEVANFAPMTIRRFAIDDPTIFHMVGRIDSMLNMVSHKNKSLIAYKASMDPNPTGILPKAVTFEAIEGSYKAAKGTKKKKQVVKPKAIEEEVIKQTVPTKSGNSVPKKTNKMLLRNNQRSH